MGAHIVRRVGRPFSQSNLGCSGCLCAFLVCHKGRGVQRRLPWQYPLQVGVQLGYSLQVALAALRWAWARCRLGERWQELTSLGLLGALESTTQPESCLPYFEPPYSSINAQHKNIGSGGTSMHPRRWAVRWGVWQECMETACGAWAACEAQDMFWAQVEAALYTSPHGLKFGLL